MQEKLSIVAIAAVVTAVFTTTLVMSLTVQSAMAATCSPKNPSACADTRGGGLATNADTQHTDASKSGPTTGASSTGPHAANGLALSNGFGGNPCPSGTGVFKNGKMTCAG